MDDWQLRLLREQDDLVAKTTKLMAFLDSSPVALHVVDKALLDQQLNLMLAYSGVLAARIERLKA